MAFFNHIISNIRAYITHLHEGNIWWLCHFVIIKPYRFHFEELNSLKRCYFYDFYMQFIYLGRCDGIKLKSEKQVTTEEKNWMTIECFLVAFAQYFTVSFRLMLRFEVSSFDSFSPYLTFLSQLTKQPMNANIWVNTVFVAQRNTSFRKCHDHTIN